MPSKFLFSLRLLEKINKQKFKIAKTDFQEIKERKERTEREKNELKAKKQEIEYYLYEQRQKGEFSSELYFEKQLLIIEKALLSKESIEGVFEEKSAKLLSLLQEKKRLKKLKEKRYARWQRVKKSI